MQMAISRLFVKRKGAFQKISAVIDEEAGHYGILGASFYVQKVSLCSYT
jgi:hypothetical protein